MRALVTGANGLLGGHLIRDLLAAGVTVRGMVRAQSNTQTLSGLNIERVVGDVRDPAAVRAAADGCDLFFHTAALFSYWGYSREEMFATAQQGASNAVAAAQDAGVKRLILTSSTSVMGGRRRPEVCNEDDQVNRSEAPDYFVTKALQEQTAIETAREKGVELIVVNPSIFIGPFDFRPSTSLSLITSYLESPIRFSFVGGANIMHVADVARGHRILAERGRPGERHILAGENRHWKEIHQTISELCGLPPPRVVVNHGLAASGAWLATAGAKLLRRDSPLPRAVADQVGQFFWYDNQKMADRGCPTRSFRDTLADTIAWLLESPHLSAGTKRRVKPNAAVQSAAQRRGQTAKRSD